MATATRAILFTDLVDSTALLSRVGQEAMERVRLEHFRLMRVAIAGTSGTEVKTVGDAFMVTFDNASDAVSCAVAMQIAQRVNGREQRAQRVAMRVGISFGEAEEESGDLFGACVVEAARLCGVAEGSQILVADVVRMLSRSGGHVFRALGQLELKGLAEPVVASEVSYQLLGAEALLLRKLPFVGRTAEYETMLKKLAEARNSRGAVVLLAGEPGIGKTRLTEEFCEYASSTATVIRGNCYEGEVSAPFGPWTEALRSLIDQTPDVELRETLGPGAPDIAVMLPEIRRRIPDIEEAPRLDPESERARLFESIGAWLRNVAEKSASGGLVIFLDDLHWCDRPSLALLEQVARGSADRRMLILGAYRDVEVDRVHPLAQTLAELRRMEHYERVAVRGFTLESVYDLLRAIEPAEEAETGNRALAQVLRDESEGNPFFIREVLNHLVETGKLAQRDGVWTGTVASIKDLGIPEGIKEVIGRRLSRLSDGCNRMLSRASALSAGFSWDELKAISGVTSGDAGAGAPLAAPEATTEAQLLDALDESIASQLISERKEERAGRYAFTHALIRQTLYGELSTPRRVLLHRQVGEALEQLYASNVEPHLPELAHHFYQSAPGGDVDKAIEYARRAGDRAVSLAAWEEAAAHYERALQALEVLPVRDERRQAELLLALGDALWGAGDREGYKEAFARAAAVARRSADSKAFVSAALGFASPFNAGFETPVIALLEEALDLLAPGDSALRAMVTARLAHAFLHSDQRERRTALGQEALAMARRVGDEAALTYTLGRILSVAAPDLYSRHGQSTHRQWTDLIDEAIRLAQETGNKRAELLLPRMRVVVSLTLGERDAADAAIEMEERLAGELRTSGLGSMFRTMQARLDGRLDAVEALAQQGLAEGQPDPQGAQQMFGLQMLDLRRAQGRLGELEGVLKRAADRDPQIPLIRASLALSYQQQDRREEARAVFDELAADGFASLPNDMSGPGSLEILADVCYYLNDGPRAAILYERLLPVAEYCIVLGIAAVCTGSASAPLGGLAAVLGRFDDAERHFEDAIEMNRKLRAPTWVAEAQLGYARMLLVRATPGDRERARELLAPALATARECGMAKVVADCERLLASAN